APDTPAQARPRRAERDPLAPAAPRERRPLGPFAAGMDEDPRLVVHHQQDPRGMRRDAARLARGRKLLGEHAQPAAASRARLPARFSRSLLPGLLRFLGLLGRFAHRLLRLPGLLLFLLRVLLVRSHAPVSGRTDPSRALRAPVVPVVARECSRVSAESAASRLAGEGPARTPGVHLVPVLARFHPFRCENPAGSSRRLAGSSPPPRTSMGSSSQKLRVKRPSCAARLGNLGSERLLNSVGSARLVY